MVCVYILYVMMSLGWVCAKALKSSSNMPNSEKREQTDQQITMRHILVWVLNLIMLVVLLSLLSPNRVYTGIVCACVCVCVCVCHLCYQEWASCHTFSKSLLKLRQTYSSWDIVFLKLYVPVCGALQILFRFSSSSPSGVLKKALISDHLRWRLDDLCVEVTGHFRNLWGLLLDVPGS